ncbi:MAG: hypothetical protein WC824_13885 [Bacteroidota bacterium]
MEDKTLAILLSIQKDVADIRDRTGHIEGRLESLPCEAHGVAFRNATQAATQAAVSAATAAATAASTVASATTAATSAAANLTTAASLAISTRVDGLDVKVDGIRTKDLPEIHQQIAAFGYLKTLRGKIVITLAMALIGVASAVGGSLVKDWIASSQTTPPPTSVTAPDVP